jgi:hypothetical protein
MKFAKIVFWIAGAFGLLASVAMYFQSGPNAYYGLIAGVLAFQVVFFLIARDPQRYRLMMIPGMLEKFIWVGTFAYFYLRGQITASELASATVLHGLLGVLFVIAFFKTPKPEAA